MAVATGTAALIAGGAAAGASLFGAHKAAQTQGKASDEALAFEREQFEEQKRQRAKQEAAAKYQWDVREANLAPFRKARAAVLAKYGIDTNVEAPPMPEGWTPGTGTGGDIEPPIPMRRGSRGPSPWATGAMALGAMAPGIMSMFQGGGQGPGVGGSGGVGLGAGGPGYAMSPIEGRPPAIDPRMLSNWSDWSNYLGQG